MDLSTVEIRIEYTRCFGTCPIYSVVVEGNGSVHYTGEEFVRSFGNREGRISTEAVREIYGRFEAARFLELSDKYAQEVTDCPSTYLTLKLGNRSKRVENYWLGDPTDWEGHEIPDLKIHEMLDSLASAVDKAVDIERWIGTEEERDVFRSSYR